ncbi:flavonol synthase/flavanone 3-hydroxylase-like [Cryptomeria japonica]|uniref:flavonol synthase/flavanone 3-hydroxylase-like n=1 Tax=Cryptomeria japonica TaxID=3369 RepID=UPI0027D9EEE1|nr:flavonol synthase/flavanone 3-hydroxylase-like [Cryptomeria japonica]
MDKPGSLPRAQTLSESGIETIPLQYVRTDLEKSKPHDTKVPVIDWHALGSPHLQQETIAAISTAAQNWGFFQIVNHGIPRSIISRMQAVGKAFFDLPLEEKELYKNEQAGSPIGYGSKLGYSPDAKLDWGDYYYNVTLPPHSRNMSKWPKQPSDFTEVMDEYSREIYKLWEVLMQALSTGLGLEDKNSLNEAVGGDKKEIHIRINYYPPCPQPELVLGLSPHSDPNFLTFLLHDETPGLQIRKDGNWVDVQSVPGALIVNIADALEIISNGNYKSIEHRSLVHKDRARMSWALFCFPQDEAIISPLPALIDKDHPAVYQGSSSKEYMQRFFSKGLDGKGHVNQLQQSSIIHPH